MRSSHYACWGIKPPDAVLKAMKINGRPRDGLTWSKIAEAFASASAIRPSVAKPGVSLDGRLSVALSHRVTQSTRLAGPDLTRTTNCAAARARRLRLPNETPCTLAGRPVIDMA